MRVSAITTGRIKAYIVKRQGEGAANGTFNLETGLEDSLRPQMAWLSLDLPPWGDSSTEFEAFLAKGMCESRPRGAGER